MPRRASRILCGAAAAAFLAATAAAHTTDWPAKRLAELYPGAETYKEVRKSMSASTRGRIVAAVGEQFNKFDETPSFYVPVGARPDGKKGNLALIYIFDAKGANGSVEMGVTVSLKGKLIRVVLFENREPRAVRSQEFLGQFAGLTLGPDSHRSPEELRELPAGGEVRGHFLVGRDIRAPEGAEASAQALATAVKKALLMMKELF